MGQENIVLGLDMAELDGKRIDSWKQGMGIFEWIDTGTTAGSSDLNGAFSSTTASAWFSLISLS